MKIQTYTARTMDQALVRVRAEIGSHAVVLHTRTVPRRGLLRRKLWVEVTAADGRDVARARRRAAAEKANASRSTPKLPRKAPGSATPAVEPSAGDLIRRTYAAARSQPPSVQVEAPAAPEADRREAIDRELAAVRELVKDVARHQRLQAASAALPGLPDPLIGHYTELIGQEVAHGLARELLLKAAPSGGEPDPVAVTAALRREIAALLPAAGATLPAAPAAPAVPEPGGGDLTGGARIGAAHRPHTIALVGPTGVGKTTTVAKLAATLKLDGGQRVGLITADTYRIAAVEQLRTYAGLIGLPLEVVSTPDEMRSALGRMSHLDAVVIDTAGRSPRAADRLDELAALLAAARPHETHLVLASTSSQRTLLHAAERFSGVKTDRLIFTKLDEAVSFGVLLNVVREIGRPLSYITTGQDVPHQIEVCDADRLAGLVMGDRGSLS